MTNHVEQSHRTLAGHVVLVTGGNTGIGLAIATGVARAGAHVIILGRNEAANESACEHVEAVGGRCLALRCDVTIEDDVRSRFADGVGHFGRLDAVFANAGSAPPPTPFVDVSLDEWRAALSTNVDGTFLCLREGSRLLVEQGEGGALVATSSLAALNGTPLMQSYAAGKAAIAAIVRGLALELARHRIRANVLSPGWFTTDLSRAVRADEQLYQRTIRRIPQHRWATLASSSGLPCFSPTSRSHSIPVTPSSPMAATPLHRQRLLEDVIVNGGENVLKSRPQGDAAVAMVATRSARRGNRPRLRQARPIRPTRSGRMP